MSSFGMPEFFRSVRNYRREDVGADIGAGLTVGIIALPLAIDFGIASGVEPWPKAAWYRSAPMLQQIQGWNVSDVIIK